MNPYYQPPRFDDDAPEVRPEHEVTPRARSRPAWFYYVGGFFLVLAAICLVLSNSLLWHPTVTPPPVHGAAK